MIRYAHPGSGSRDAKRCYSGLSNFSADANSAVSDYRSAKGRERKEFEKASAKCKKLILNSEYSIEKKSLYDIIDGCDSETLNLALSAYKQFSINRFIKYLKSIVE